MDVARFNPTRQQALGRGLYLGVVVVLVAGPLAILTWLVSDVPPRWWWPLLILVPPLAGALGGLALGCRPGTEIDAGGIHTVTNFAQGVEPWSRVVDLRAERRGARTVVSVYLDSGVSLRLRAPYSGDLLGADPRFELKVLALSHLWRSHRFGGVPS
jgi:hypothetical protein